MIEKIHSRFLEKDIKWDRFKYQGHGSFGTAFQINKTMVMKITADKSEMNTMTIVMKNPSEFIVKVYDTFQIKIGCNVRYFIIQKLLKCAKRKWALFANDFIRESDEPLQTRHLNSFKSYIDKNNWKKTEKDIFFQWIKCVCEYFDKHSIRFHDIHPGNIMRDDAHHVLIDLGASRSPKQQIVRI